MNGTGGKRVTAHPTHGKRSARVVGRRCERGCHRSGIRRNKVKKSGGVAPRWDQPIATGAESAKSR